MRKIKFIFQKEYGQSLDLKQWSRILEEASPLDFNCFSLKLLGDVVNSKLKGFLDVLTDANFLVELEDEGLWDEERKEIISNSNINLFTFSFYGLTPETHNNYKNNHQAILDKINYIRGKGLPIGLRFVLTKENFSEIFNLPKFLQTLNCPTRQVIIEEISPLDGKLFKEESLITPEQLKLYLPYLKRYILGFPNRLNPQVRIYSNYQNQEHYPFLSGEELVIEGNGDVRSFPFFGLPVIGNVFSESLLKINENLIEDLNRLTLEKAENGLFLNWSSVIPHCPQSKEVKFQDIDRIILPDNLSILMNKKCNFRCDFCEFDCKPEDKESIDIEDFEKLLQEAKQLGIKRVVFDGGEPLFYPQIKKAFKIVGDLGYQVTILTNGWYFEDFLDDYKKNNITNFIFGIYGASPETNDVIVNKKGAFEKCVSAIKSSKKLGYSTGLHTVLHPLNFSELDKFLALSEEWQVDYLMISPIVPIGRAEGNRNLILSKNSKSEIAGIYQRHQNFLSKIMFAGYQPNEGRNLGCKYLERSGPLSVHWNGAIALCSMTPLLKLPLLKIKEHSFIDCLTSINKINELFQRERNQEFPYWKGEIKEVPHCLYCHEKLPQRIKKYINV